MSTPLPFCTLCSNLLPPPPPNSTSAITCPLCHTPNPPPPPSSLTTTSKPSAFPSTLRTRLRSDVQALEEAAAGGTEATIRHTCEKCGCEEVRYHEVQLRSADEGSTIFYTCPECGFRWNTNN